jgi:hypothetical protein
LASHDNLTKRFSLPRLSLFIQIKTDRATTAAERLLFVPLARANVKKLPALWSLATHGFEQASKGGNY